MSDSKVVITTYCCEMHNVETGAPIAHRCRILPTKFLIAERDGDIDTMCDILETDLGPLIIHPGEPLDGEEQGAIYSP